MGGTYTTPAGVDVTQAYAIANATIARYIADKDTINFLANGWQLPRPPYAGDFGTNYAHRAYIARTGYQQLRPSIVLYPGLNGPAFGPFELPAGKSFLYTWYGKPPVRTALNGQAGVGGFWSLTFYGEDQYLISNGLGRFSVGDRPTGQGKNGGVELTYPDGEPVYGSGSNPKRDGIFQVLVQPANIKPPANWTTNWLPAPSGGGKGTFICELSPCLSFESDRSRRERKRLWRDYWEAEALLAGDASCYQMANDRNVVRFYAPSDALSNGKYKYPKVETIDAIRA